MKLKGGHQVVPVVSSFIIEHRVKGYYIGHESSQVTGKIGPKWKWSIPAYHRDVYHFHSQEAAQAHLKRKGDFPEGTYIKEIMLRTEHR